MANYPYFEEIPFQPPLKIFKKIQHLPWAVFLDSVLEKQAIGEYSFIGIDPFIKIISKNENAFEQIQKLLTSYRLDNVPGLPPFQGGLIGYFGYELNQYLEEIPIHNNTIPDAMFGMYDLVIAFDLISKKTFLLSTGMQQGSYEISHERAISRINWLKTQLRNRPRKIVKNKPIKINNIQSNFNRETYIQAVQRVIDYTFAGDIFQANISQQFTTQLPNKFDVFHLYCQLRTINPAPFAAYLNFDQIKIVSASPERFLKLDTHRVVETRPIKGTRRRHKNPILDLQLANELKNSAKDNAENTMIVDLLRNDISRVCKTYSVVVEKLCEIESYKTVHHLVSVIKGILQPHHDALDLLKACFPGGSITGCPKIRAMQIINEIELLSRGPYCGNIGYIGFSGCMDTSIVIRSYVINKNTLSFQVGGGVVADSDPATEYEETLIKAQALIKNLTGEHEIV